MTTSPPSNRFRAAFTLIEVMVSVLLLSVIILGLIAMFDQTRRAFALGLNRGDFEESGRVAINMIQREVEQMSASGNFSNPNFYVDMPGQFKPVLWPLGAPGDSMTNAMQRLFFVTRYNRQWSVTGYRFDPNGVVNGVGTLYRYASNNVQVGLMTNCLTDFVNDSLFVSNVPPAPMFSRIVDGVVDFRVRAFDINGVPVEYVNLTNAPITAAPDSRAIVGTGLVATNFSYFFTGNAIPAYVELELDVLEARTLEHYRALALNIVPAPPLAAGYLTNHAGQVHVFRARIPIRSFDAAGWKYQ